MAVAWESSGRCASMTPLPVKRFGQARCGESFRMQVFFLTALVSFDRVFELLDLQPLITDRPGALMLPVSQIGNGSAPKIEFDQVCFRYPTKSEISLASLESIALPTPERSGNVLESDVIQACEAARIWDLISSLPDGLDTVAGDRGYRFSGGEKQRLALARLLLKAPPVVVLDEATAHLDSESEVVIQQALRAALVGRTSLVIAHRLSAIREADQILVIDEGRIRERGTHEEPLAAKDLYAELYRVQFARQSASADRPVITPGTVG